MNLNAAGMNLTKVYACVIRRHTSHRVNRLLSWRKPLKGYGKMFKALKRKIQRTKLRSLDEESIALFRDKFGIPISDGRPKDLPYYKPA